MSLHEINPDFNLGLSQTSASSPFVDFAVPQSSETFFSKPVAQVETQQFIAQLPAQKEPAANEVKPTHSVTSPLIWLLPIWGAIVWLLLIGTASEAWKLLRYSATPIKQGQRVPCKNCRFFSSNFYLKCAVRPSDALTERAVDCSDFCQKSIEEELKPQTKRNVRH